ncbi:MAG: SCO family protein [Chitinophagales bacterium]|jgi:protein SCO1/2|nr:SCO family protein [Chitinophagales bacterium]
MNKNHVIYISIVSLIIGAGYFASLYLNLNHRPFDSGLNYYGPDAQNAKKYVVKPFSLLNQDSQIIQKDFFEGSIWVTEFFFSTCQGICPVMNKNMIRVQDSFRANPYFKILSHTVDPEYDKPYILKSYKKMHKGDSLQWQFVTGSSTILYDLARSSYFIAGPRDSTLAEDFVHSQLFCLIDPHFHIRGYYDGTDSEEVAKLISDIKLLQKEFPYTLK